VILIINKYLLFHQINDKYCGCESRQCSLLTYDLKALTILILYLEETGSRFLWNTGNEITQQAVSLPTTQHSSRTSLFSLHQKLMIYSQSIIIIHH